MRDVEVDELGAVVVALPEGNKKVDLPYRDSGTVGDSLRKAWLAKADCMSLGDC